MTKKAFIKQLNTALMRETDRKEIITYYEELIDEAILNGEVEQEFIEKLGPIDQIVLQMDKTPYKNKTTQAIVIKKQTSKGLRILLQTVILFWLGICMLIGFSFLVGGPVQFVRSLIRLFESSSTELMIYYVGEVLFAFGLTLMGFWIIFQCVAVIKKSIKKIKRILTPEEH